MKNGVDGGKPLACMLLGVPAMASFQETAALRLATELAGGRGAKLSLYVFAPPLEQPVPLTAGASSSWIQHEAERLEAWSSATLDEASKIICGAGIDLVSEQAHSPFERRGERFVQLARVNDLTILDAADASDGLARRAIEDVLFDSGSPVLVVPSHGGKSNPRRVAIAWDGSARAARAVKDSLALIKGANLVVAVTVAGEKDLSRMAPGADLATYLAHHGITCKISTLAGTRSDVGARMRLFVAEEDIDLIVMGAFVHARFREAVLGGVTRSLLDECPVPLYMSH